MNTVPQVETAEISDADLDRVSGGIGLTASTALVAGDGALGAGLYAESGPLTLAGGLGASAPFGGAAAQGQVHTTMV
ncbi:Type A2 lantipeptide OS=Streptomyces tendae OX=1932 GN=GUR47_11250 PE=4 SV=1 [Streptomyces tendae]